MDLFEVEARLRPCSHSGCMRPAAATLAYDYKSRRVWLHDLPEPPDPASYDLCADHVERFRPPRGWQVEDHRASAQPSIGEEEMFRADVAL
ncbi:MAG: DUF3499 family protein [Actinomycetota bacterium]